MGEVSGPELALAGAGPLSQTEHGLWGATDSPGRLEPWQDKQGFPRPLDGPTAAPRTTGIRGDQLLEPAGPEDLRLADCRPGRGRSPGLPSVPSALGAPFPGQHLPLPGGHSFVFCEDKLAMRLSFILICIFISVWTKLSINRPSLRCSGRPTAPGPLPSRRDSLQPLLSAWLGLTSMPAVPTLSLPGLRGHPSGQCGVGASSSCGAWHPLPPPLLASCAEEGRAP